MSFNYKPKIILQDIDYNSLYNSYQNFTKDVKYQKFFKAIKDKNLECNSCKKILDIDKLYLGIPINIKEKNSKFEIEVYGQYCSLSCSYKHYLELEENPSYKRNILFADSGPIFHFLSYKLFQDYNVLNHFEYIDLETKDMLVKIFSNFH